MTRPSTANGGFPNVVVTAVTATTSIAPDIESTWKGLLAGESGIRVLEDDFVEKWDLAVKIGGHLKEPLDPLMTRLEMRRMSYVQRMSKYLGNQLWDSIGASGGRSRPFLGRDRHRTRWRREDRRDV